MSPILSPVSDSFAKLSMQSPHQQKSPMLHSYDVDPRRLLRRRSSLVIDDLPHDLKHHTLTDSSAIEEEPETNGNGNNGSRNGGKDENKISMKLDEKKKKPPPTQFKEPDANSLLDAFGF
jgi:hypothetical protein